MLYCVSSWQRGASGLSQLGSTFSRLLGFAATAQLHQCAVSSASNVPKQPGPSGSKTGRGKGKADTKVADVKQAKKSPLPPLDPELLPKVAIVGRPNVGKSALFNRLVQKRDALVHNTPEGHVTRDYKDGIAALGDLAFRCIDTSGLEPFMIATSLQARATMLTQHVLNDVDLALVLLDARVGVGVDDESLAQWLRVNAKAPLLLVANKCERRSADGSAGLGDVLTEAARLGLGEPVAISAETGEGMSDLYTSIRPVIADKVAAAIAAAEVTAARSTAADSAKNISLSLMGLPNVGKSTLSNRLIGKERSLTGPEPGLTRDVVRACFEYEGYSVAVEDTAGRMKANRLSDFDDAEGKVAAKALAQGTRSMQLAQVVVFMVDSQDVLAREGLTRAEVKIVSSISTEGRSLVVVANKADLLPPRDRNQVVQLLVKFLGQHAPEVTGAPILAASALSGGGVSAIMPAVTAAYDVWDRRVSTSRLNRWLARVTAESIGLGGNSGALSKIRYITQVKARPPTIVLFTRSDELSEGVRKQLVNRVRRDFDFGGVPIRMIIRPSETHAKHSKKAKAARGRQ